MARRMGKRAFITKQDRPEVRIDLNKSVAELSVRDLSEILSKNILKVIKDSHKEKFEKLEHKELKIEKIESKELKLEKLEKIENEQGPKRIWEQGPDPKGGSFEPGPELGGWDPVTIDTLVKEVAKLQQVVADLQQKLG
jgi:hypothetical protein